jgi:uncharacterized protein (UPF0332 family)
VTALSEAREHLRKAKEFLTAAEFSLDLELFNAATSNAVTSGINAKDAICLRLTGKTGMTENHMQAVEELKASGAGSKGIGAETKGLAVVLGRLLQLKAKSQYGSLGVARNDAIGAVEWAQRLVDGAAEIVAE